LDSHDLEREKPMATVQDILKSKGQNVYAVSVDDSIECALKLMAEKGIGAVVVMNGKDISGIFSERDFARKTLTINGFSLNMPVLEVMSTPVFFVHPDQSMEECMTLMTEKRIRHIPVMEDGKLTGVISIRDVIKWLIADRSVEIQELEQFVSSKPQVGFE
jgi:CBS domain-containing protein